MTRLHLDYETASDLDLKKTGAYKYAEDETTRILMLGWAVDDNQPQLWLPHETGMPAELRDALTDPHVNKHAFNAAFERLITRNCAGIEIPPEQWRCTMVESFYLGFAGGLDQVLKAVGLMPKDDRGKRLINTFSKPAPKNHKADWYNWENKPVEWEEFCQYCLQDVHVERQLWHWMQQFPTINEWDYAQWCNDQRINDRGVPMDVDLALSAIEIWDKEKQDLSDELATITGLPRVTRGPFLEWLVTHTGVSLDNLRKDYLAAQLKKGELPEDAKEVIGLWAQKEGKATSKYTAVVNGTCDDGRARGMFQYKGASRTDRVGGRLIQLQNLKRPIEGDTPAQIDNVVNAIKCSDPRFLKLLYPHTVSDLLGGSIRHVISARPGHTLAVCDLTSIESVILGWVAMCPEIDSTFRQGRDSYRMFASKYYGINYEEVTKAQRSFSKPPVLGCFAAGTEVLTDIGWLPIELVTASHRVYDGDEWVECDGVVDQGTKHCIEVKGVTVTPDHLFLTGENQWTRAEDFTDERVRAATDMVSGRYFDMWEKVTSHVDVPVEQKQMSTGAACVQAEANPVLLAPTDVLHQRDHEQLLQGFHKQSTIGCATEGTLPDRDAKTQRTLHTSATEGEVSPSTSTTSICSSSTLSHLTDGKTHSKKLTGLTTTEGMDPVISDSLTEEEIHQIPVSISPSNTSGTSTQLLSSGGSSPQNTETKAQSPGRSRKDSAQSKSSQNKQSVEVHTYDVLNAGPRNRFTIKTDAGPVVVHNCGFMLGWKGLIAYAEGYGVDMTQEQAKTAVDTFRSMYPEIPRFWDWISKAVMYVCQTGIPLTGYRMTIERDEWMLRIWLPSGRALSYFKPEVRSMEAPWSTPEKPRFIDNFTYMGMNDKNQWVRISAHAGGLTENVVQSLAGDILWNGIMNVTDEGWPVILHVHDEIALEVPDDVADTALSALQRCMVTQPDWCKDMWLGADGFLTKRYTKD